MRLAGRCAFVTGAASGLGRATAELLHEGGAAVILADLDAERLQPVATALGKRALLVVVDVRNVEQVEAAISLAKAHFGAIHIAVNCAGIAPASKTASKFKPHGLDVWQRIIDVNLTGTFNVLRLVAAAMIQNSPDDQTGERGVIVNTASIAAFEGQRGQAAYAASKAGIVGLTLPVARDLAEHTVRCVAIAPGLFETALIDGIPEKELEGLRHALLFPNRPGHPSEFAALVKHAVENPYLNGVCLRLDGAARLP